MMTPVVYATVVTGRLRKLLRNLSNQIQIAESAAECLSSAQADRSPDFLRKLEEIKKQISVAAQTVHAMHDVVEDADWQQER